MIHSWDIKLVGDLSFGMVKESAFAGREYCLYAML